MAKKKILVVDDNKEFLEEIKETLSLSGYEVVAINDAATAFEIACAAKPDVVLLDLKMPGKTGFKVADEITHSVELKHIPIVAMTGHFTDIEYSLLINLCGIKKCLLKPFNPLDVITQIEKLLREDTQKKM